ncbi:phosphatidylglycerophosphate synthase, putative [Babesia caballi]|uniref:CDP-diacylglycerol--glycerol-3-phosphate 3-phosphatidyltransferase n=1 Tax=Babesia caballi TaxID=5871 RepID=A0AAV4LQJ5_BABCB|nr:phosphatidylglycerophosphate synthase, putative [Babesia caballi]
MGSSAMRGSEPMEAGNLLMECAVDPSKVAFLASPDDFYRKLCRMYSEARERIVLVCLYVGCGQLEEELVRTIVAAKERNAELTVDVMVDRTRTCRIEGPQQVVSPLTMLQPYLGSGHRTTVALFHNPLLGRLCRKIFKSPYCEAFGTMHMKIYMADDECIITGANAGRDYFCDRYDRYMVVKDALFADLMHTFVRTFQTASFVLTEQLTLEWRSDLANPFEDNILFRKQMHIRTKHMVRMCKEMLRKNRKAWPVSPRDVQAGESERGHAGFAAGTSATGVGARVGVPTKVRRHSGHPDERGDCESAGRSDHTGAACTMGKATSQDMGDHASGLVGPGKRMRFGLGVDCVTDRSGSSTVCSDVDASTFQGYSATDSGEGHGGDEEGLYCIIKICLQLPFTDPAFMEGEKVLQDWLLEHARAGYSALIATAYLNFTERHMDVFKEILDVGKANGKPHPLQVVTSSPYANSFYKDGSLKRKIALFYSTAAMWLFKALKEGGRFPEDIYLEYDRPNHTFHAKGIWVLKDRVPVAAAHASWEEFDACVEPPCATAIGSSNYGRRSYDKDLEVNFLIETNSPTIKGFMKRELYDMLQHSQYVPYDVVKARIEPLQLVLSHLMKSFF